MKTKLSLIILIQILNQASTFAFSKKYDQIKHVKYQGGAIISHFKATSECHQFNISLPVWNKEKAKKEYFTIHSKIPKNFDQSPLVIIVPTILGPTLVEKSLSNQLCASGYSSFIAHVNDKPFDHSIKGIENLNNQLMTGVLAIRTLLDYLTEKQSPFSDQGINHYFEANRIGLIALSNGSFSGSLAAAIDSRIRALMVFPVVGNAAFSLAYSENSDVKAFRYSQIQNFKLNSQEEFRELLSKHILIHPTDMAENFKNKRVYQVIIREDNILPLQQQLDFANSIKPEKVSVQYYGSHENEIVNEILIYRNRLYEFLKMGW